MLTQLNSESKGVLKLKVKIFPRATGKDWDCQPTVTKFELQQIFANPIFYAQYHLVTSITSLINMSSKHPERGNCNWRKFYPELQNQYKSNEEKIIYWFAYQKQSNNIEKWYLHRVDFCIGGGGMCSQKGFRVFIYEWVNWNTQLLVREDWLQLISNAVVYA
jgi:hypothetical protein